VAAALYGTFTAIIVGRDTPPDPWSGYHCLPGVYFDGAAVFTGAALTRWFRDQFGQPELERQVQLGRNAYESLDQLATEAPPGCDGLVAMPDFTGAPSRLHPGLSRGALIGLTIHHTRAHVYRALLEAIAYELRFQLEEKGTALETVTAVGGGANNMSWTQIMSDVLNVRQNVLDVPAAAPFGDAYLAGMACGMFSDTQTLRQKWLRYRKVIKPQPRMRETYQSSYEAYRMIRQTLA
jgi:xylulokinase